MLNIIYCELLKLKKSYIIHLAVISGMFMLILMDLVSLISKEKFQSFKHYSSTIEMLNILLLYTILFSLITGHIFSREFTDKTASVIYACSVSRIKIFIGKLITIYMLISLVYIVRIISIYLSYYILMNTLPESTFIVNHIEYNVYSLIFEFLLVPIPILITNMSKNLIFPVVYGIVGTIITIITSGSRSSFAKYVPFLAPYESIMKIYNPNLVDLSYSVISGIVCFIVSMIICLYQYNKDDII